MKHLPNDQLKYIFSNVNYWINFAELKHGILITLNSALIYKGIEMSKVNNTFGMTIILLLYLVCPIIALSISISSYFPNTNSYKGKIQELNKDELKELNVLFYMDIAKFKKEQYIRKIYSDCNCKEAVNKLDLQYAEEIIINSEIALRKYENFKLALFATCTGIVFFILGVIITKFKIFV